MFKLKKYVKPSILYFGLVYLGYVLTLVIPSFRTGVFASALLVALSIEIGLSFIKSDKKSDFISLINVCVLGYFVYNVISVIWIIKNGYPVSIFVEEFSNSVLPLVFFFAAVVLYKGIDARNDDFSYDIYKAFIFSFAVFSIICIIFYVWAPQFYCDYLVRIGMISKADASTCHVRMEGFTGSTSISFLAVAAMLVSSKFMYVNLLASSITEARCKIKELDTDKKNAFYKFVLYAVLFVFFLVVVFLANGRAGMVAAILVILYLNFLIFCSFKFIDKKYLYIEIGAAIALVVIMCIATPSIAAKIGARLISLPGAIGQRSEQWIAAMNNMYGQWFGNGLGANGHKAISIEGAHIVADGGLVKLYCEEGALGFSLYVFILIVIFREGIKDLKNHFCELGIIGTALLMSIGSNIIAFQLCVPLFWLAAGIVAKDIGKGDKKCE